MKKKCVIDKANNLHSEELIITKAVEECGELCHAVMKYKQFPNDKKWIDRTLEELADVSIIVKQLGERLDKERYRYWKDRKLKRLNKRLNKIEKEND
jgi:NTP pyrophosphatase (non-canonical NTP hydrolase)